MFEIYTRYKVPKSPVADSSKPSLTQQEFKESCDINNILAKFSVQANALGVEPSQLMPQDQGTYGDFSNLDDFQTDVTYLVTALGLPCLIFNFSYKSSLKYSIRTSSSTYPN